ncbi:DUF302 domain-containing protein [Flavobacterium sp. ZT3R18]|uniref:DUF302 domain-containing protein n=1 Tax=Flavobacterium sp. ZT3R18 TaxID=2594429 RepID=UPI00117BC073|nr:DUF302 domain-containing protein [Flavobacterium sp. ZT3R18]TRX37279.1 DUF302 domain-containing protein [Flavobacterium sp. ZT3R18]
MDMIYVERIVDKPFFEIIDLAKSAITKNGFLVLHEINTTEIMMKFDFEIKELRQLLFFHPEYMKLILEIDPSAVIKVPLKMVVREINENQTAIICTNPIDLFLGMERFHDLSLELSGSTTMILKDVIN